MLTDFTNYNTDLCPLKDSIRVALKIFNHLYLIIEQQFQIDVGQNMCVFWRPSYDIMKKWQASLIWGQETQKYITKTIKIL